MQKIQAAAYLAGVESTETAQSSAPTNVHLITGEVTSKSEEGQVAVAMDGLMFSPDNEQSITMDTLGGVEEGDTVTILLSGESGHGMSPIAIGGVGTVDRIVTKVEGIEADYIKATELEAEVATLGFLTADSAAITDLEADTAKIHNLTADSLAASTAYIAALTAGSVTAANIIADKAKLAQLDVTSINADHAVITNLSSNFAHITNGVIDNAKIGYADVNGLNANYAHLTNGIIDNAYIDQAKVNNLFTNFAHITNGVIDNAKIGYADVNGLSANYAHVVNGIIDNASISYANVEDLSANYAQINLGNVNNAWITNGVIADAAISDAQIFNVSANKLTAGTLDASRINVANLRADSLIVNKINGQPVIGGYEAVNSNASGYASKNPQTLGWYEIINGVMTATTDTSVNTNKAYYTASTSVALYDQTYIDTLETAINNRIDGAIETFTGAVVPTLTNWPYTNWYDTTTSPVTDNRAEHVGDIYYVVNEASDQNGYCYRFTYDNTLSSYMWVLIKDSDVTAALSRLSIAENDIDLLQSFESTTASWIEETDEGLTTIRNNHTALSTRVDGTIKDTILLYALGTNGLIPKAPVSYNDIKLRDNQNGKVVDTNGNDIECSFVAWSTTVPSYNSDSPVYYYCYQHLMADNTYRWSNVFRDNAVTENQESRIEFYQFESTTFKTVVDEYDRQSVEIVNMYDIMEGNVDGTYIHTIGQKASTVEQTAAEIRSDLTDFSQETTKKFNGETTTVLSTTANSAKSTAEGNSTKISNLTSVLGTNADGTSASTDIVHKYNELNSDLDGVTTRVGKAENKISGHWATSSTESATEAKVATISPSTSNWELYTGAVVTISFSNANTSDTPTLNINSTGAKQIKSYDGTALSEDEYSWDANSTRSFIYDGTYWRLHDNGNISRIGVAESQISQLSDEISLRVTTEDFNDLSEVVDDTVKNVVQLWALGTLSIAPKKPVAVSDKVLRDSQNGKITDVNGDDITTFSTAWKTTVPTYNPDSSVYYYCYQYLHSDNTYSWSDVVKDTAATESRGNAYTLNQRVTRSESFIKINSDNIELKVSKDGVISSINQSPESVKIQASKVEIDGAAVFTSIKSLTDVAYDAAGAASTAQANATNYTDTQLGSYSTTNQMTDAISAAKNNVILRTQRIWYRSNSATPPSTPGIAVSNWVTKNDDADVNGVIAWTKKHVKISSTHYYIYTCEQYELGNNTLGYTTVLRDDSITVIDGGNLITGSVKANSLDASDINASNKLTVGAFTTASQNSILNSNVTDSMSEVTEDVTMLWCLNGISSAPVKPIQVDDKRVLGSSAGVIKDASGNDITASTCAWTEKVPTNVDTLNYYYCYQYARYDGTYDWTTPIKHSGLSSAINKAEEAITNSKSAIKNLDKYVTEIDGSGIKIHPSISKKNYLKLDANGMDVIRNETSVAFYGETERIGKDDETHIEVESDKLTIVDGTEVKFKVYTSESISTVQIGTNSLNYIAGQHSALWVNGSGSVDLIGDYPGTVSNLATIYVGLRVNGQEIRNDPDTEVLRLWRHYRDDSVSGEQDNETIFTIKSNGKVYTTGTIYVNNTAVSLNGHTHDLTNDVWGQLDALHGGTGNAWSSMTAGTTVLTVGNGASYIQILSASEVATALGVSGVNNTNTIAIVQNGDYSAYDGMIVGSIKSDGTVRAYLSPTKSGTGTVRFNYLLIKFA